MCAAQRHIDRWTNRQPAQRGNSYSQLAWSLKIAAPRSQKPEAQTSVSYTGYGAHGTRHRQEEDMGHGIRTEGQKEKIKQDIGNDI